MHFFAKPQRVSTPVRLGNQGLCILWSMAGLPLILVPGAMAATGTFSSTLLSTPLASLKTRVSGTVPSLGSAEEAMLNRVFEGYKIPEWKTLVGAVSEASGVIESAKALQRALN